MSLTEFQEMRSCLPQARLGSYLVIPLKYEQGRLDKGWLDQLGQPQPLSTMDLTEPVKELFDSQAPSHVGVRYQLPRGLLVRELLNGTAEGVRSFQVRTDPDVQEPSCTFDFFDSWLYLFHTQVALLCLGLCYSQMETLIRICNPGFAENNAEYYFTDSGGRERAFSLNEKLTALCALMGLEAFFPSSPSMILEANTYNLAVTPRWFQELETIRRITFNQHRMTALDLESEDQSEDDVRYVYSVRNQDINSYRWGCCISSQTLSYAVADEQLELEEELRLQAQDGLPLLALALYEKYTCLRFTQLITAPDGKKPKRLRRLKRMMLEFQAFGTVSPANISRWHNVKKIYEYILETNGVPEAINDIHHKLSILIERQQEIESARNDTIGWLLTLFGITSILASVLSIIQILSGGSSLEWSVTILSSLIMFILMAAVVIISRRGD